MKFFIVENNQQAGPFSIEEMQVRGVTPSTLVWREGMSDWTPASQVPELGVLFASCPAQQPPCPPLNNCQPRTESAQREPMLAVCPKTWLVESILVTLFCCLPFGIVGIIKASSVSSKFAIGDFAGAQQASNEAKRWTIIGFVCGAVGMVLYIAFICVAAAMGSL